MKEVISYSKRFRNLKYDRGPCAKKSLSGKEKCKILFITLWWKVSGLRKDFARVRCQSRQASIPSFSPGPSVSGHLIQIRVLVPILRHVVGKVPFLDILGWRIETQKMTAPGNTTDPKACPSTLKLRWDFRTYIFYIWGSIGCAWDTWVMQPWYSTGREDGLRQLLVKVVASIHDHFGHQDFKERWESEWCHPSQVLRPPAQHEYPGSWGG